MDKLLERLNHITNDPEARSAYADAITSAFLTAQIKELREQRGMTQDELAKQLGTQQSGISRWQKQGYSNCKVDTLRKFARAYGVRLRITFEEFGTLPDDIGGFSKQRLAPRKFEDDPTFKPKRKRSAQESAETIEQIKKIAGVGDATAAGAKSNPPDTEQGKTLLPPEAISINDPKRRNAQRSFENHTGAQGSKNYNLIGV